MSTQTLKSKISKSLDEMDEAHLRHAYEVLQQIVQQQKCANIKTDKQQIDTKIRAGIRQLDGGEGTDIRSFLNENECNLWQKEVSQRQF
jgi:hypothetical protein